MVDLHKLGVKRKWLLVLVI